MLKLKLKLKLKQRKSHRFNNTLSRLRTAVHDNFNQMNNYRASNVCANMEYDFEASPYRKNKPKTFTQEKIFTNNAFFNILNIKKIKKSLQLALI